MKNFILLLFISLSLFSCKKDDDDDSSSGSQSNQTQTVNLQIDSFTTGPVQFQSGFVAGDAAAVTLGPLSNTFKISYVKFLLGGTGVPETKAVEIKIYIDNGQTNPDSVLFGSSYLLTSSDDALQELDLRSHNITVTGGGSIRIAIETGTGLPSVAVDADGTLSLPNNWIYTGGTWSSSYQAGITSDFIIRAVVEASI